MKLLLQDTGYIKAEVRAKGQEAIEEKHKKPVVSCRDESVTKPYTHKQTHYKIQISLEGPSVTKYESVTKDNGTYELMRRKKISLDGFTQKCFTAHMELV